jgi:CRP-like cAMP-binding protein
MTQSSDNLVEMLSDVEAFSHLAPEAIEVLVEATERRRLMMGESLWTKDEPGSSAFVLVSGRIEISRRVQPGGQRNRQISDVGALLSLPYLIEGWTHESSAYPVERSELLELTGDTFRTMFEDEQPVAYALVDAIADEQVDKMRDVNDRLQRVFGQPAETLRMLKRRAGGDRRR